MKKASKFVSLATGLALLGSTLSGCVPDLICPDLNKGWYFSGPKVVATIPQEQRDTKLGLVSGDFMSAWSMWPDGIEDLGYIFAGEDKLYGMAGDSFLSDEFLQQFPVGHREGGVGWAAADEGLDGDIDFFRIYLDAYSYVGIEWYENEAGVLIPRGTYTEVNLSHIMPKVPYNADLGLAAGYPRGNGLLDFAIAVPSGAPEVECPKYDPSCECYVPPESECIDVFLLENQGVGTYVFSRDPIVRLPGVRWDSGFDIAFVDELGCKADLAFATSQLGKVELYKNKSRF